MSAAPFLNCIRAHFTVQHVSFWCENFNFSLIRSYYKGWLGVVHLLLINHSFQLDKINRLEIFKSRPGYTWMVFFMTIKFK